METEPTTTTSPATPAETLDTALKETEAKAPVETKVEAKKATQEAVGETTKAEVKQVEPAITKEDYEKAIAEAKATVKGGYEGTVKQMREENRRLQQAYQDTLARMEDSRNATLLEQVRTHGGDDALVQEIINRATAVSSKERAFALREQELALKEQEANMLKEELGRAAFNKKMLDLMTEYKLPKEATKELAAALDATEMELLAVKMAMKVAKTTKPATKVASEGGTSEVGVDLSKLSRRDALELALREG